MYGRTASLGIGAISSACPCAVKHATTMSVRHEFIGIWSPLRERASQSRAAGGCNPNPGFTMVIISFRVFEKVRGRRRVNVREIASYERTNTQLRGGGHLPLTQHMHACHRVAAGSSMGAGSGKGPLLAHE